MKTKNTFIKILAFVFSVLVFMIPSIAEAQCSCTGNVVQNPSFENSSNNWTESGGHFHIESGSETVCGSKYGRFHISNASSRAWQQLNSTSLGAGASIAVTFYAAVNDASHTHEAGVYYWDASWNLISKQVANINKEKNASPAGLQLYSFNSVQPVGVTHVTLEMRGTDGSIYSDAWCVTVTPGCPNNVTSGGTIGNDESYCTTNFDPANIISLSAPSGGTGALEYIWMQSTNGGSTSAIISGANAATYDPPAITQTTWYRRGARRAGCTTYNLGLTNWVKKEVACITTDSVCFVGTSNPHVNAKIVYTTNTSLNTVTVRTTFSKNFVDNTYGNTAIKWPGGHSLGNLEGSDKLTLELFDAGNTKKMELVIDYIEENNNVYYCGGVTSGEGGVNLGNPAHVLGATSSLHQNLNQLGYGSYTTNSPATDTNYTPNPAAPNWIYDVWYEVTVDMAAFGTAGFGYPRVASVHASPSKTGSNTEVVVPGPCPTLMVSGTVFYDYDALDDNKVNGTPFGKPANTTMYVNLVNDSSGKVTKTTAVTNAGTYSFSNMTANTNYTLVLSTTQGTIGNNPPNAMLPTNWINTGESPNIPTHDGLADGKLSISLAYTNMPNLNYGIQNSQAIIDSQCLASTSNPNVTAKMKWTITGPTVTIRATYAKKFVDNTYGSTQIGWPGGHTLGNLEGSDKLTLDLYDATNTKKMELVVDYIEQSNNVYYSGGVTSGEGKVNLGNAAHVLEATTSLHQNFNQLGYSSYTTNSPATDTNYTPNPAAPNWIYDVWYEVTIDMAAFGTAGFGYPKIVSVHASPSKTGNNTEIVIPTPCPTVNISGNVYNDINGLTDNTVNGTALNDPSSIQLYANLINTANNVSRVTAINNNGKYTFMDVPINTNFTVVLSTTQGTLGNTAPSPLLPIGWQNTGEDCCDNVGSDGTVDGKLAVATGTTSKTNANFGIQQPPTPGIDSLPPTPNPGDSICFLVPGSKFSGTDPSTGGVITSLKICTFPTGVNRIDINGISYTSTNWPASGVTIPTNGTGMPTQNICIDPPNGSVTSVIKYSVTDNAGASSLCDGEVKIKFYPISVSGTVFNDINGLTDNDVNGVGIGVASSVPLHVILVNTLGNIVKTTPVASNGTYSFSDVTPNTTYTTVLATTAGTVGNTAPTPNLPMGWENTGESPNNATSDGIVDGKQTFAIAITDVPNIDFGIQQPPTPGIDSLPDMPNPGDSVCVVVPGSKFKGTDPSVGGVITQLKICTFPTGIDKIEINGVKYYASNFPATGVTIPTNAQGVPTQNICIDPKNGLINTQIKYSVIDNAASTSACNGEVNIKFYPVTLSGIVFNDESGPANVDGSPISNASGNPLYANLIKTNGTVAAVAQIDNFGMYTFSDVSPNNTYDVVLTFVPGTVGNASPSAALPTGWVNVSEDCCDNMGNDGTTDGKLTATVALSNVINANFGIREPVAVGNSVWVDSNRNGVREANEIGLGGAVVKIYTDDNNNGSPDGPAIDSLLTSSNGLYKFEGLHSGKYIIGVLPPAVSGSTYKSSIVGQEVNPNADIDNNDNGIITIQGETFSGTINLLANTEPINETPNNTPNVPDFNSNLTLDFGFFDCPNNFVFDTVLKCVQTFTNLTNYEPIRFTGGVWTTANNQPVPNPQSVAAGGYKYTFSNGECSATGILQVVTNVPDYAPTIEIEPNLIQGPTPVQVILTIGELLNKEACSDVYVLVPKLEPRYLFNYDSTLTSIGFLNESINNPDWQFYPQANPNYYIWRYKANNSSYPAGGISKIGYVGVYNPNNTDGVSTFSVQIFQGSGGETNSANNTDSEELDYTR